MESNTQNIYSDRAKSCLQCTERTILGSIQASTFVKPRIWHRPSFLISFKTPKFVNLIAGKCTVIYLLCNMCYIQNIHLLQRLYERTNATKMKLASLLKKYKQSTKSGSKSIQNHRHTGKAKKSQSVPLNPEKETTKNDPSFLLSSRKVADLKPIFRQKSKKAKVRNNTEKHCSISFHLSVFIDFF